MYVAGAATEKLLGVIYMKIEFAVARGSVKMIVINQIKLANGFVHVVMIVLILSSFFACRSHTLIDFFGISYY